MTEFERARRYVESTPGAISGSDGHGQTISLACALVRTYPSLTEPQVFLLLKIYNEKCSPPWSDPELAHKASEAFKLIINRDGGSRNGSHSAHYSPPPEAQSSISRGKYRFGSGTKKTELPDELPDSSRLLLKTCFRSGEGIRLVDAKLDEDGTERVHSGITLTYEDWMQRLDKKDGEINRIFKKEGNPGIYCAINPLKAGGTKDSDVLHFRHALIEFDDLPKEKQWELYRQSNLPCAAVIDSGGKSLHAWVRVDAESREEYNEKVKLIYEHFADYKPDRKNSNPSRLSRFTGCARFDSRQRLLAVNIGAPSFDEWAAERQLDGLGNPIRIKELLEFVPENDPNQVLGHRWLCKGGSMLLVGPSGIGKSSLAAQMVICWALGKAFAGIKPDRPLRSMVLQAENDDGDLAEMIQGVLAGMDIDIWSDEIDDLEDNIVFQRNTIHTGKVFVDVMSRLIDRHRPDIVWIDPLLSFIGADISKQEVCSTFLRNWLNPVSERTGVIFACVHHTGKPPKDAKSQQGWTSNDFAYLGLGSSELVNWARAVCVLRQMPNEDFELKLAKRGKRAGATDLDGKPTNSIYLKHADHGIQWIQTEKPEEVSTEKKNPGRPVKAFDYNQFYRSIEGESFPTLEALVKRACMFSEMRRSSVFGKVVPLLKERMTCDPETGAYSYK